MFYQDIVIPESGYEHIQHSINQIISLIHSYNFNHSSKIAIDFPELNKNSALNSIGTCIRLFSISEDDLKTFNSNQLLDMLLKFKLINQTNIKKVPTNVTKGKIIFRERIQSKNCIKAKMRRIQNKINKKLIDEDKGLEILEKYKHKIKNQDFMKEFESSYIHLISKSNHNHYIVSVKKIDTEFKESNINNVNSYGLSLNPLCNHAFIIPVF